MQKYTVYWPEGGAASQHSVFIGQKMSLTGQSNGGQHAGYVYTVPDHFVRRSITLCSASVNSNDIAPISVLNERPNYMNVKPFCGEFKRPILNKCGAKSATTQSVYTSVY